MICNDSNKCAKKKVKEQNQNKIAHSEQQAVKCFGLNRYHTFHFLIPGVLWFQPIGTSSQHSLTYSPRTAGIFYWAHTLLVNHECTGLVSWHCFHY